MKLKQRNIRVFELEIESYELFESYMQKNGALFKESFLLLRGNITHQVTQYLENKAICFKDISTCSFKSSSKESFELLIKEQQKESFAKDDEKVAPKNTTKRDFVIIDKPIRSGEKIDLPYCAIILSRINSGAQIKSSYPLELYEKVDGNVECSGDFLIVKSIGLGIVKFHGITIDTALLDGKTKLFRLIDDKLDIKDVS